ncbi:hypothetical protein RhiirC2_792324 [Rhizophagus irregularis]|uniref:Uncharacterized protein n=1 Tax=Rhizophagus irregularis TaxID=588596 RepID=A0A2N1MHH2_9GLOM|nr:hypothetical protein RhiirC2_792324 [Rhizophagus irregularis]
MEEMNLPIAETLACSLLISSSSVLDAGMESEGLLEASLSKNRWEIFEQIGHPLIIRIITLCKRPQLSLPHLWHNLLVFCSNFQLRDRRTLTAIAPTSWTREAKCTSLVLGGKQVDIGTDVKTTRFNIAEFLEEHNELKWMTSLLVSPEPEWRGVKCSSSLIIIPKNRNSRRVKGAERHIYGVPDALESGAVCAAELLGRSNETLSQLTKKLSTIVLITSSPSSSIYDLPERWLNAYKHLKERQATIFSIAKPHEWKCQLKNTHPITLLKEAILLGSCHDPIITLEYIIHDSVITKQPLWILSQEISKAFDSVDLNILSMPPFAK